MDQTGCGYCSRSFFPLLSHFKSPTCPQGDILRFQKIRLPPISKQDNFHVLILEFFKCLFILPSGPKCAVQAGRNMLLLLHIFYSLTATCMDHHQFRTLPFSAKYWTTEAAVSCPQKSSGAQLTAALQLSKCAPVMGIVMPVMVCLQLNVTHNFLQIYFHYR